MQRFFRAIDQGEINEAMGYLSSSTLQSLGDDKWQAALIEASHQMADQGGLKSVQIVDETVTVILPAYRFV